MPRQEVLVLAMTKMRSGICTAGLTLEPDPVTGLRWVRPVRDFDTVQPGDMTYADGRSVACCDVVELSLIEPRPDPPHVEDWLTDFVHHRPRLLRRLEGEKRARFFRTYPDRAPEDVLVHHTRSLCLVQPEQVWVQFSLDAYSGKYETRMGFVLTGDANHPRATGRRGVAVTDLKWRALGRSWLGERGFLALGHDALLERLGADALYLAVGLSRNWQGEYWPLVVGVHVIPDYVVSSLPNGIPSCPE
ncbi:MAG: dual OB domain-containing protein [Chloroflexota bacterium]